MIPSLLDRQLRHGVADFVRTTFSITTPSMARMVDELCDEPGRMFKGPYISLGLPFKDGIKAAKEFFPELKVDFTPYMHQELAWERVNQFQSTLVATGTGSGKTECFLYPILNHARLHKERGWQGITAVMVYPMNALASDQARRMAEAIWSDPALKGKVTAGLYVGGEEAETQKVMGPDMVITDREALRLTPPDILLTNYKMLDYLLIREKDKKLWEANQPGTGAAPATIRYLVVDELHTFDGAQGTDLALLIRRLKHRLGCNPGQLCCVGTSATLGGGDSKSQMLNYADQIFGESFLPASLITEQRQTPQFFLSDVHMNMQGSGFPVWGDRARLRPGAFTKPESYLKEQVRIWFPKLPVDREEDRLALGRELKGHTAFRVLIDLVGATPIHELDVLAGLARHFEAFDPKYIGRENSGEDEGEIKEFLSLCLASLIALVAHARAPHPGGNAEGKPFIQQVRVQSWLRELRRMVATISKTPRLDFADDITRSGTSCLPVVFCRECGNAGWVGLVANLHSDKIRNDEGSLGDFYKTFFQSKPSQHIRFLFPDLQGRAVLKPGRSSNDVRLCTQCLKMNGPDNSACSCGSKDFVEVLLPDSRYQDTKGHWFTRKHCPGCGTRQSLVVLGAQSASLSSALINQLFASPYNDDKKLIAFSDNVQDAAHRASFFGARTWKFNFRAAVYQYLMAQKGRQPLKGLGHRVLEYWQGRLGDEVEAAAMFLPSDLDYLNEVREAREGARGKFTPEFWNALGKRLDWETFTEFGLDCRKGRTLEKSGCSSIFSDTQWRREDLEALTLRLQNLNPALRDQVTIEQTDKFLHGMVRRWIHNGAIQHPALDSYVNNLGNPYLIHKFSYSMKGFGIHSRTPSFPWKPISGKDREERLDPIDSRQDKPTSWYAHWVIKHWGLAYPAILFHYEEIMNLALVFLEKDDTLHRLDVEGTPVWRLNPERILVDCDVGHFRCHVCGHLVSVPVKESAVFEGMQCLKASCNGLYQPHALTGHYYGELYEKGDLIRLMPSEHTALLSRDDRKEVEKRFKAKGQSRTPWDPNLLSCTPTLELGVDIGDLSSVLLCSVPPEQAAFLQRIGRAGRADGNAVMATVAEGRPHDLYFWADPLEMLHGRVEPPGVFLDATAVLERQLMAFCLDRWICEDSSASIPPKVSALISNWKGKKPGVFPGAFIKFISENSDKLLNTFMQFLGSSASSSTHTALGAFMNCTPDAGSFSYRINECFALSEKIRNSLMGRRRQLDGDINKRKKDPASNPELIEELKMERDALSGLIRNMDERSCYQYLTDEGLIPNYAFPEAGVQLKSIIYRRSPKSSGTSTRMLKTIYEYERASAAAISDFAPGNYFYANHRRVQINQVDTNTSQAEMWRLCPECGYMELEITGSMPADCAHCGSRQFGSMEQVQRLLRIRQVYATSGDKNSLVGDDSDSRDVRFFERSMVVGLRTSELLGAWQLDDPQFPFGFEVRRRVLLREMNFGPYNPQGGSIKVAGRDIAADGFELCKACGRVTIDGKLEHTFHCAQQHPDNNQTLLQATFLYRDFEGEVLRLFLPTLSEGSENDVKSLLAALHLGLRLHYQGDVSHLQATMQSEPVPGNQDLRKQFIVLYDTVPGGTGYLKQFVQDPMLIRRVLQKAQERMAACACQENPGRDGCYRCLLAHRNSREMDVISRRTAMDLTGKIIDPRVNLKEAKGGVSGIDLLHVLESELERKFISTLNEYTQLPSAKFKVSIKAKVLDAGNGYELTVNDQTWIIMPQVNLGAADGLAVETRADFVISHATNNGLAPVVLYTDGWEYHHGRMSIDTRQRLAIHRSGKYRVWTLMWNDLDDAIKPTPYPGGLLSTGNRAAFETFMDKMKLHHLQNITSKGNLLLLLKYLSRPSSDDWGCAAYGLMLANLKPAGNNRATWTRQMEQWIPSPYPDWPPVWEGMECENQSDTAQWNAWAGKNYKQEASMVLRVDDGPFANGESRAGWHDYWRAVNVFQFLPDFIFVTENGIADGAYSGISLIKTAVKAPMQDEDWQAVMELCSDERLRAIVKTVHDAGGPLPQPVHEVIEDEAVAAQAELAWPNLKIAIVTLAVDLDVLKASGWKVQLLDNAEIPVILKWLKE